MKIYIAGKYEEKHYIGRLMNVLRDYGHEITYDWTQTDEGLTHEAIAAKEYVGVIDCDIFIGIFIRDLKYQGAFVEMGMALARNKRVIVVGDYLNNRNCIFMALPAIQQVSTVPEIYKLLTPVV